MILLGLFGFVSGEGVVQPESAANSGDITKEEAEKQLAGMY